MNIEKYAKFAPQYYTGEAPKILLRLFKNHKFDSILDCGCGDGSILYALNKEGLLGNLKVNAIDLSKDRIEIVKRNFPKFNAKVDSAETMNSIGDNSQDLVISTQVIEHVDDEKMTTSFNRVLKDKGTVYLSTVFKKWYGWYFYKNNTGWVLDPTHLREYTNDEQLTNLLKKFFTINVSNKTTQRFPLIDFITKRLGVSIKKRDNLFWKTIRALRIPILGYYNWELVLTKKK